MIGDPPATPTILLVDPTEPSQPSLAAALETEGYTVWQATTGADARKIVREARRAGTQPDTIVLQQSLPDVDGRVLAAFLHKDCDAPIVLCGPGTQSVSRAVLHHVGIDAYLPLPVHAHELDLLLQSLLRRARPRQVEPVREAPDGDHVKVGPLMIHERRRAVSIDFQPVALTPIQYRLLVILARRPNALVPTRELTETVWNCEPDDGTASLVATQMARLRAKLRDNSNSPLSIVSVPSRGYRLLAA